MPGFLENSRTRQGLIIIAATCFIIVVSFGMVAGVLAHSVSIELFFLFALILPAFCLPATAFSAHAKEKKRAEAIIETKNRHLSEVLDNMAQGLCMFDGEQRLIVCNKRYASLYGLSSELVKPGTSFSQILEYRVENGIFSGGDCDRYVQKRLEEVSERIQSTKIQKLSDGRIISISHSPMAGGGWVATHEDITEQKKADTALMETEARFRAVFENSPFCQNLKDTEGRYLFANKQYEEWWGHSFDQVDGKKADEIFGNSQNTDIMSSSENVVMETGETYESEISVRRPRDGERRDRWLIKFPVKSPDGQVLGLGTFAVDITERKRAEEELIRHRDHLQELVNEAIEDQKAKAQELEEALKKEKELNELQRQFVTMASHEFRTPLAIIDTTAQRIKSRADKDKLSCEDANNRVEKIRGAVRRMTRLMESTLSAARMEDGKISVEINPCNIEQIICDVCARQQEIEEMHTISCDLGELPATIQADEGSLEQVLSNLLSNAVKYAPDAPQIDVSARTEGIDVIISVRDHGLGIDEEDLPRIGERFFRAKSSTGITGTGIGLNLVNKLVELHGGKLSIESKKGDGSTFSVSLPIAGPVERETENIRVA
jgi:PAS domain S-box-containing protein